MTKQQAYELAEKELQDKNIIGVGYHSTKAKDRSMEIYAAAFAEWVVSEQFVKLHSNTEIWVFSYITSEDGQYTTSELITEFEKI